MNDSMTHHATRPVPPEVQTLRDGYDAAFAALEAGEITMDEMRSVRDRLRRELDRFNATTPAPQDCPSWCNKHNTGWHLNAEDDWDNHVHKVEGDDWYFEIDEAPDGGVTFEPMEYRSMTLAQARLYALGILRALDTVDGRPASGRIGRRIYTTLVERQVDTDLLESLSEVLGVDVLELVREG